MQEYIKDGVKGTYWRWMTADELVYECIKDKTYYEGILSTPESWKITDGKDIEKLPGGVTFSGGEALLQMDRLIPVCDKLHEEKVHTAVETALFVPKMNLELAIRHIDFFYCDMKILDADRCKAVEKGSIDLYLENLNTLMTSDVPVVIRVPVIGGQTDGDENRAAVKELLWKYKDRVLKVELIKEHNLGESKYRSLGLELKYAGVDDSLMEKYKTELDDIGVPLEICKI